MKTDKEIYEEALVKTARNNGILQVQVLILDEILYLRGILNKALQEQNLSLNLMKPKDINDNNNSLNYYDTVIDTCENQIKILQKIQSKIENKFKIPKSVKLD